MATLSLREISESQLSATPIINGQLICCLDTGRFYRDTASSRVALGEDMICVSSLPLAPISDRIYLLKPNKLYIYDGGDWVALNEQQEIVITVDSIYDFPSIGSVSCVYIATSANKLYRWDATDLRYYCIGSNYDDIDTIYGGSADEDDE